MTDRYKIFHSGNANLPTIDWSVNHLVVNSTTMVSNLNVQYLGGLALGSSSLGLNGTAGFVPRVGADGVIDIGRYIDFHEVNTVSSDYDFRLTSTSKVLYASGTILAPTFNATSVIGGGFQGIDADTVAAPSFTWTIDQNTGIYHYGTDIIGFTTGGASRGFINANGFNGSIVGHSSLDLPLTGGTLTGDLLITNASGNSNLTINSRTANSVLSGLQYINNNVTANVIAGINFKIESTGSFIYLGTSNSWGGGITKNVIIDPNGYVTANKFIGLFGGDLTGNVTGNVTGTSDKSNELLPYVTCSSNGTSDYVNFLRIQHGYVISTGTWVQYRASISSSGRYLGSTVVNIETELSGVTQSSYNPITLQNVFDKIISLNYLVSRMYVYGGMPTGSLSTYVYIGDALGNRLPLTTLVTAQPTIYFFIDFWALLGQYNSSTFTLLSRNDVNAVKTMTSFNNTISTIPVSNYDSTINSTIYTPAYTNLATTFSSNVTVNGTLTSIGTITGSLTGHSSLDLALTGGNTTGTISVSMVTANCIFFDGNIGVSTPRVQSGMLNFGGYIDLYNSGNTKTINIDANSGKVTSVNFQGNLVGNVTGTVTGHSTLDSLANHTHTYSDILDAPIATVAINTTIRDVMIASVINSVGYNSRLTLGLKRLTTGFGTGILGIGTNDGGTTFCDYEFSTAGRITSPAGTFALTSELTAYLPLTGGQITGKVDVPTAKRSSGMYGSYDSTKTGQVWSMGTSYSIDDAGVGFGTLYGIAYKYATNVTGGIMAGGHQIVFTNNGTANASIGLGGNIWTSGYFQSTIVTGTAPLTVASTTMVANLNSQYLNGQLGTYYAPINSPTLLGNVTLPTGTTKIGITTLTQGGAVNITFPTTAGTLALSGAAPTSHTLESHTSSATIGQILHGTGTGTYGWMPIGTLGQVLTVTAGLDISWITPVVGANTTLSNLGTTAINTSLISDTDSTDDLGSTTKYWRNTYSDTVTLAADPINALHASTKQYTDAGDLLVKDPDIPCVVSFGCNGAFVFMSGYFMLSSPNTMYYVYYGTDPGISGYTAMLLTDLVSTPSGILQANSSQPTWDFVVSIGSSSGGPIVIFTSKITGVPLSGIGTTMGNTTIVYLQTGSLTDTITTKNGKFFKQNDIKNLSTTLGSLSGSIALKQPIRTYSTLIKKLDIVWENGWIKINNIVCSNFIEVKNVILKVDFGHGLKELDAIINYPSAPTCNGAITVFGFYLLDSNGLLREDLDFSSLYISYDTANAIYPRYNSLDFVHGENIILDEDSAFHSNCGKITFNTIYSAFSGTLIESVLDPLTNYNQVNPAYTATYLKINNANIITKPYANGAVSEEVGSNPDVLTVASHYDNVFVRHDITSDANTFLSNTIAVGSRPDDITSTTGCTTYGFGLEFFELANNVNMSAEYPQKVADIVLGFNARTSGNVVTVANATLSINFKVGDTVIIGQTNGERRVITAMTATTLTVNSAFSTNYTTDQWYSIWGDIGQLWKADLTSTIYAQSPVCTMVAAKLKHIKMDTGASWSIVRQAARATASNHGVWDMYRGFGKIDVTAAINWINTNYKSIAYRTMLANQLEGTKGISTFLTYSDLLPNSPVSKKLAESVFIQNTGLSTNYLTKWNGSNLVNSSIIDNGNILIGTSTDNGGRLQIIPSSTPITISTAKQLIIGEASSNTNYNLAIGYFNDPDGSGYKGSIQSKSNSAGFTLCLNANGGNVTIGNQIDSLNSKLQVTGSIFSGLAVNTTNSWTLTNVSGYQGVTGVSYMGQFRTYVSPNGALYKDTGAGALMQVRAWDLGSLTEKTIATYSGNGSLIIGSGLCDINYNFQVVGSSLLSNVSIGNGNEIWGNTGQLYMNYRGAGGGTTAYATLNICDGKTNTILGINGSTATVAVTGKLTSSGTITGASILSTGNLGFHADTYATNVPNPIWSFANSTTYGIAYYQGTALAVGDSIGFHFGNVAVPKAYFSNAGNLYVSNIITAASIKLTTGAVSGYYLKSDASGNATWSAITSAYKGTWNASLNSPLIANGSGSNGDWYRCTTAGTWNSTLFNIGDDIYYSNLNWQRVPGTGYTLVTASYSVLGGIMVATGTSGLVMTGNYLTVAFGTASYTVCQGNDIRLSDTRIASDVYAWAKASVKPTYTFSEITSKPTSITGYGITIIGSDIPTLNQSTTGNAGTVTTLNKAQIESVLIGQISTHTHDYIPFTGATKAVNLNGQTITANDFITASDARLKTNIVPIIKTNLDIQFKEYEFKSDLGQKRYGVIAQDLLKIAPELVDGNEHDGYAVRYIDLLIRKNAELENRIKRLEELLCQ